MLFHYIYKTISYWERLYFLELILLLCHVFAVFMSFKYYKSTFLNKVFLTGITLYLLGYLVLQVVSINTYGTPSLFKNNLILIINNCVIIIEYTMFSLWLIKIIKNDKIRFLAIFINWILLFSIAIIQPYTFFHYSKYIENISFNLNTIEFISLLIICLCYFHETSKSEIKVNLSHSPSFWLNSGLLVYITSSIPFLICGSYLHANNKEVYFILNSIHYISLSMLFLTFAKAFSLNKLLES
jgi:hypothetical protein